MTGDIKQDEVVTQIREAYTKSKSRSMPPEVLPAEPRQTAAREVIEEEALDLGNMMWDVCAINCLSDPLQTVDFREICLLQPLGSC